MMAVEESDHRLRLAAFAFLDEWSARHGDVVLRTVLERGFLFEGVRVPLVGPQGIFKPAAVPTGIPLTITTAPVIAGRPRPYDDEVSEGLVRYRYRGTDPNRVENVGLRRAMQTSTPLIYLYGLAPGRYLAAWPVFVVDDDPAQLCFSVAVDDPQVLSGAPGEVEDDHLRRLYVTRLVRQRIHQAAFRERVLAAYRRSCAMCRLRHEELLDAAHILPDVHPLGEPVVSNGLSLCKLHHAAFDVNIVGVRPDMVIEVRADILGEIDGPMLRHGLQGLQGARIEVPRLALLRPNIEFLAGRYEAFRQAG